MARWCRFTQRIFANLFVFILVFSTSVFGQEYFGKNKVNYSRMRGIISTVNTLRFI